MQSSDTLDQRSPRVLLREMIMSRPTRFLATTVRRGAVTWLTDGMCEVQLAGESLADYRDWQPADAIKLFLPARAGDPVPIPVHDADGKVMWGDSITPPIMRCLTVTRAQPDQAEIRVVIVDHDGAGAEDGALGAWLSRSTAGDQLGLVGVRSEFVEAPRSVRHLVVADSSALPAVRTILDRTSLPCEVIATAAPRHRALLAGHPVTWADDADGLEPLVRRRLSGTMMDLAAMQMWVCGESGTVKRIRTIARAAGVSRDDLHAAGYWTAGEDWAITFQQSLVRFHAAVRDGADVTDPAVLQAYAFDEPPQR